MTENYQNYELVTSATRFVMLIEQTPGEFMLGDTVQKAKEILAKIREENRPVFKREKLVEALALERILLHKNVLYPISDEEDIILFINRNRMQVDLSQIPLFRKEWPVKRILELDKILYDNILPDKTHFDKVKKDKISPYQTSDDIQESEYSTMPLPKEQQIQSEKCYLCGRDSNSSYLGIDNPCIKCGKSGWMKIRKGELR